MPISGGRDPLYWVSIVLCYGRETYLNIIMNVPTSSPNFFHITFSFESFFSVVSSSCDSARPVPSSSFDWLASCRTPFPSAFEGAAVESSVIFDVIPSVSLVTTGLEPDAFRLPLTDSCVIAKKTSRPRVPQSPACDWMSTATHQCSDQKAIDRWEDECNVEGTAINGSKHSCSLQVCIAVRGASMGRDLRF